MKKLIVPFLLILLIFQGCSTGPADSSRNKIAIFKNESAGGNPSIADVTAEALKRSGFDVTFLSSEEVGDTGVLSTKEYFLYVIPDEGAYPTEGEGALINFVQQRGNLLVLGTPKLPGEPLLETISPHYKMYPMHDIASLKIRDDQGIFTIENDKIPVVPTEASSCFRRPTGKGFECGYSFRWIPILTAHDKNGLERGTAAWMLINQAPLEQTPVFKDALRRLVATTQGNEAIDQLNVEGAVFAACAIKDHNAIRELAETSLFGDMATKISQGLYLSHAGLKEFSYWPGEQVRAGATVINYGSKPEKVTINITIADKKSGAAVFSKKKKINVPPGGSLENPLGSFTAEAETGGYDVRTELIFKGEIIDIIKYDVGILSTEKEPKEEFITVEGTKFKNKGKDWYPIGVNYWPRNAIATEQVDYLYHWLTPGYYEPEQIDDDLQRLEDMGANFVAMRANYINDKRTVLDFLRRCRNHNIFAYILLQTHEVTVEPHYFEGIMMPFYFRENLVSEFIEETKIAGNPALMAWDLIWEPSNWLFKSNTTMFGWNGNPNFRQRWDDDWAAWIDERYGSLANAELDWGVPVPRTSEGEITSPPDEQFEVDGKWRIMVAAYRRFMADIMNRQYNDACQVLRKLDPNHLISYRQGNLPPVDYTLISTHKHVDFFSMEAYSFPPKENGKNKVGFVNRYLSYALKDKPFMWNEYGYGGPWGKHTRHLDGEDVVYQYEYVEMVNSEAYKNGANGIAPWWFPGGLRASEKTDFGITTPEGTLRPSGQSLKKYGELYRDDPPERPEPDTWMTIDMDANSGGLWYITNTIGADAYEEASEKGLCLGIKTRATGTTSANTPLLAVGNTEYNGTNPPKYLNAEFNWFRIKIGDGEWQEVKQGKKIRIPQGETILAQASVGNLQEATWLAPENNENTFGCVYLASTEASGIELKQSINKNTQWNNDTDFGGSFPLTEGIDKETDVELQMTALDRAWFGEKLRFTLVPGGKE